MSVLFNRSGMCLMATVLVVAAFGARLRAAEKEVPLVFSGGHALGEGDFGRPINLMAAGLGVKPEQFREAFSGVTPAKGRPPTREEERRNKAALMRVLKPLGVTNERMDEVANYYRFRPQAGEMWPTAPSQGYSVVEGGRVQREVITEAG
jgi:hypothetical protein